MVEPEIELGQELTKKEIHRLFGGSDQHAMTSCMDGSAFLVFYDPKKSRENSYDEWEGEQVDGTFSYTGQGLIGDQKMTRSNLGLVRAADDGRPIHFFRRPEIGVKRKKGNPYTYAGRVVLGSPAYRIRTARDKIGNSRRVFVFNLLKLSEQEWAESGEASGSHKVELSRTQWVQVPVESTRMASEGLSAAQIELQEHKLQNRFAQFLNRLGLRPMRVSIQIEGLNGSLVPDFVVMEWGLVIEAKPTISREHVRLAIGQVLDYQRLLHRAGENLTSAVLLPGIPQYDLCLLLQSLDIRIICEREIGTFEFVDKLCEDDLFVRTSQRFS